MNKISCIIPAFNEEKQIETVLNAALKASRKNSMEIIVVNDGSTDRTAAILSRYGDVRVITNKENIGKSRSIARALEASNGDYILMLDADLIGLTAKDIFALLSPIQTGAADVTLSIRRNSFMHMRLMKLDFVTGERAFPRALIADRIDEIKTLPNFGLEVFLNDLIIERKYAVKTVYWNSVSHTKKHKKRGFYPALKADTKMARDILRTVSLTRIVQQHVGLKRQSFRNYQLDAAEN